MFIDGGFSSALIQKKRCTQLDYSSVYFLNIVVAGFFYMLLALSSSALASFFAIPELESIIGAIGLVLPLSALTSVPTTILTKELNFKLLAKVSVISTLLGSAVSLILAYQGWGVWALVWRSLIQTSVTIIMLFALYPWRPTFAVSIRSLRKLFKFGSNLLLAGLANKIFDNAFYFVIGKWYSPGELGLYTRADMFSKLPAQQLTSVVQRVSFPVLVAYQDDNDKLKNAYKQILSPIMFVSFLCLFVLAAMSESIIFVVLGDEWHGSIKYLQLLCFSSALYPLHALNLNILNVKGRSDMFLKLEGIKKVLLLPVLAMGIFQGINVMLVGMIVFSLLAFGLNALWSSRLVGYSLGQQILDLVRPFGLAVFVSGCVYALSFLHFVDQLTMLLSQLSIAALITICVCEASRLDSYLKAKGYILSKVSRLRTKTYIY